jgi:hypothetical protein
MDESGRRKGAVSAEVFELQKQEIYSCINNLVVAVQAVQRELVSKCDFPVQREKTGNFKQNGGFRATGVAKNSNSSVC